MKKTAGRWRLESSEDGGTATVVGTLPAAYPGEDLHVIGKWVTHHSHGRQFAAEYAERSLPRTKEAIYAYLAGARREGHRPRHRGAHRRPLRRPHARGAREARPPSSRGYAAFPPRRPRRYPATSAAQAGLRRLMEFLCAHEIKPLLAVRLYRFYGEDAMETVNADPYILASPHIGGSFAEADRLAFDLGGEAGDERRRARGGGLRAQAQLPATGTASSPRTSSPPSPPSSSASPRRTRARGGQPRRRRHARARVRSPGATSATSRSSTRRRRAWPNACAPWPRTASRPAAPRAS